ncbi:YigZ family protein [Treponema sp.]|uniref:YigZ family protein n=1 Tax=Treponema sp. TaxID=166 RepID=UPI00388DDEAB
MKIPKQYVSCEEIIKGSRFLSELFLIESQEEVREKIKSQKKKYPDATHVCHAFICGKNAEIMGMSDDGEPSGTAGRPMLDVLKGSGATNLLVTITRWFGGTLLGTGGLVHAYGDGVKNVLAAAEFEEFVEKSGFSLSCDYQQYQVVKKIFENFTLYEVSEDFGELISIKGQIAQNDFNRLKQQIFDTTNGKVMPILTL